MKLLSIIFGTVLLLVVALYGLAFTSIGNSLVAPSIEKKVNNALHVKTTLKTFTLDSSTFNIVLALTPKNIITLTGSYELFAQSFNVNYNLELNNLEALESLTKEKLYGEFHTNGTAIGNLKKIDIKGSSDIASSKTSYDVTLTDLNPSSIKAVINGAKTEEILALVGKAPYAISTLHVNANMSSIDPKNLQGDVKASLKNGHIDIALMKNDFNVTLPKTKFSLNSTTKLEGKSIDYNIDLNSNLAKLGSKGSFEPESMAMDLSYQLNIAMLELLKPITNAPLRGKFNLKGTAKGNKSSLHVKGSSDLANSNTTFSSELKAFKPQSITADIKNLNLKTLLHMVEQPHYLNAGLLSSEIRIKEMSEGKLDGSIATTISKGLIDAKTTAKAFELKPMPQITFNLKADTTLRGDLLSNKINLNSNFVSLYTTSSVF